MKIIITGINEIDERKLANKLVAYDDSLSISSIFTTSDKKQPYRKYIKPEIINLSFKNNSLFFIYTKKYISEGITIEDYYNNNIFITSIEEFNNISDKFFTDDTLTIWLDEKVNNAEITDNYKWETKFLINRLPDIKYMYFVNNYTDLIAKTIIKYINSDETTKQQLLIENS